MVLLERPGCTLESRLAPAEGGVRGRELLPEAELERSAHMFSQEAEGVLQRLEFKYVGMRVGRANYLFVLVRLCRVGGGPPERGCRTAGRALTNVSIVHGRAHVRGAIWRMQDEALARRLLGGDACGWKHYEPTCTISYAYRLATKEHTKSNGTTVPAAASWRPWWVEALPNPAGLVRTMLELERPGGIRQAPAPAAAAPRL